MHYLALSVPVPSTCASGQINVVTWDDLVAAGLRVMALPADVSAGRVRRTMCADVAVGYEGSDLLEEHAEALVARYYGWGFGAVARHGFPEYCTRSRTR